MTFVTHTAMGAASVVAPVFVFIRTRKAFWASVIIGGIIGSLPDVLDWLVATLGLVERWRLYHWFHHDMSFVWQVIFWPMGLHLALDSKIHLAPGYSWWPDFWYVELGLGLGSLVLLVCYYTFIEKNP